MAVKKAFYITAAIPYVNAKPHLGHLLEWFQADTIARWQRQQGKEVRFTCGADENSLKNVQAAEKAHLPIKEWLDSYAQIFKQAFLDFNISITDFGRGSDEIHHWPGVQALWQRCLDAGDIYSKTYAGLYCVGCESYYTESELVNGLCPEHLNRPELIEETNYFFRLSKYESQIKHLISSDEVKILSDQFKQEMLGFISLGLEDFSVSRSTKRARGVGVPVPNDDSQVMYVWFDALSIYLTAVGWTGQLDDIAGSWPADVHCIGKGITRFHALYWIGMLLSAGLPLPKAISVHGYITMNGQKMSKSLGNSIDPYDLVKQFGLEPVRYYLLRAIPTHSDGDYSEQRFREVYTAELANGLGNLCSRIAKVASSCSIEPSLNAPGNQPNAQFVALMESFELDSALALLIQQMADLDKWLAEQQPWKLQDEKKGAVMQTAVERLREILWHIQPFLPTTSQTLLEHFSKNSIDPLSPIFPRLEETASTPPKQA